MNTSIGLLDPRLVKPLCPSTCTGPYQNLYEAGKKPTSNHGPTPLERNEPDKQEFRADNCLNSTLTLT